MVDPICLPPHLILLSCSVGHSWSRPISRDPLNPSTLLFRISVYSEYATPLKTFADIGSKVQYIKNLLGPTVKLSFQSWRSVYPEDYQRLVDIADDTINVTNQIRQMILGYTEYRGQTQMQEVALLQLENSLSQTCNTSPNMPKTMPY
ncbi:hypothetical protein Fmac_006895 [Flemingia macrophylla]|uniref:Uncharacterized protein n=1 Tax=Flemingia macrophylla TaxID=520843 RepID=A0ABD1NBX0_9FABA